MRRLMFAALLLVALISSPSAPMRAAFRPIANDFDGDGRTDLPIYRQPYGGADGRWLILRSAPAFDGAGLGIDSPAGWHHIAGDLDGDGLSDTIAIDFSQRWHIRYSRTAWSAAGGNNFVYPDTRAAIVPFVGTFDESLAPAFIAYEPARGLWNRLPAQGPWAPLPPVQWGRASDAPVPGDYDGDGITDLAVWRPSDGRWYILDSRSGYRSARAYDWGAPGDVPFPGDFDGDGLSDLAVFRPSTGTWYILFSSTQYSQAAARGIQWGADGDSPRIGDYDGDGRTDLAVWRERTGTWYLLLSSADYRYTAARGIQWGSSLFSTYLTFDVPLPQPLYARVLRVSGGCGSIRQGQGGVACTISPSEGSLPDSSGLQVFADLRTFGGSAQQRLSSCFGEYDVFAQIPADMAPGPKPFPAWAVDAEGRRADVTLTIQVEPR